MDIKEKLLEQFSKWLEHVMMNGIEIDMPVDNTEGLAIANSIEHMKYGISNSIVRGAFIISIALIISMFIICYFKYIKSGKDNA